MAQGPITQEAATWASLTVKKSSSAEFRGLKQAFLAETSNWKRVPEGREHIPQGQPRGLNTRQPCLRLLQGTRRSTRYAHSHLEVMDDRRGRTESGGDGDFIHLRSRTRLLKTEF